MSLGNPEGFPWGANDPARSTRALVSLGVALIATGLLFATFIQTPLRHTDFSNVWFGAKMLLEGKDPYPLLGPGRVFDMPYPLLYPASTFVITAPFGILSERMASLVFTFLSVSLMTYGITVDGWHRAPMIASAAFMDSLLAAQWTIIMTAALFLPWLAFVVPGKPQTGLAIIAGSRSVLAIAVAGVSAALLTVASLILYPGWPAEWVSIIRTADYVRAPILNPAGIFVVFVLLRWRRPESWLVFVSACLPQTFMWYGALVLLATAATYRQAITISLISTAGYLVATWLVDMKVPHIFFIAWTTYIATTFLPCVVMLLMQPNQAPLPAWMTLSRLMRRPR